MFINSLKNIFLGVVSVSTLIIITISFSARLFITNKSLYDTEKKYEKEMSLLREQKTDLAKMIGPCVSINGNLDSERYRLIRDSRPDNSFTDDYKIFETQLKQLLKNKNLYLNDLCSSGYTFAFTATDSKRQKLILGGMYRFHKNNPPPDEIITTYEFNNDNVYILNFFTQPTEVILSHWEAGMFSCQTRQDFLFDLENKTLRKIRDCKGCLKLNEPFTCSLDVFQNSETVQKDRT